MKLYAKHPEIEYTFIVDDLAEERGWVPYCIEWVSPYADRSLRRYTIDFTKYEKYVERVKHIDGRQERENTYHKIPLSECRVSTKAY